MKIAFLNAYNGVIDRGAETYVKELAKRLAKKHEVVVFQSGDARGDEGYRVEKIAVNWDWKKKSGDSTILGWVFLDYWSLKIAYFSLKASLNIIKHKFNVVIPVNGGWMPAIMRLATWIYGGKLIISGQAGIGWHDRNNLWCFPDRFVALSTFAQKWAKKAMPIVKVVKISNGVDIKKFSPKGEKIKSKLKKPIVFCAAALTPTKRVNLVIKAVSKIPNLSLLIAGQGSEEARLRKLAEKLLPGRFEIKSFPYTQMPKVYRTADVFTLASKSDYAFEIVLVEAMASGLPVVANNDPIRAEIVDDAGYLINPQDSGGYARALKDALSSKRDNKALNQAKKFDWNKISSKYEKLFHKLK